MTTYKLVMPGDLNHYGFLFGGKMLLWTDEVAWVAVSNDFPRQNFVTVGMSEVCFRKSVHPKSILRFSCERTRLGRTSVTYHMDVFCRPIDGEDEHLVFHTDVTFVHLGESGEKAPIISDQASRP